VQGVGEPHRFGWEPRALSGWLQTHNYVRMSDHSDCELARRHLSPLAAEHFAAESRHVAVARSDTPARAN
jgi:hypothetical protein